MSITMKFTKMIHTSFAIIKLHFHKASAIFNKFLPAPSKMLYTNAVKFPASTSKCITKILFQVVVLCKMASTQCIPYRAKQMAVGGYQIWAVSGMGMNSPNQF
jgi:hypothetical protein